MKKLSTLNFQLSTLLLLLLLSVSAFAQDMTVCAGKGFRLTSSADAVGDLPITYTWYEEGEPMDNSNVASIIVTGMEPGIYRYMREAANSSCTVQSNTYTVKVSNNPSVNISPPTTLAEEGTVVVLTATADDCSGCTYTWSTGETTASIDATVPAVGNSAYYSCTVTTDAGCSASSSPATVTGQQTSPTGDVPYTACTACCWSGSTWVNCYVTTNAYPFDNTSTNTNVGWSGNGTNYYSDARSDRNGRANTAAISSTGTSAVQICKNLGTGWYLPAYEELVNMSSAEYDSPLNGKSGANLLVPGAYYWSSTEYYDNGGRFSYSDTSDQNYTITVSSKGSLSNYLKNYNGLLRCAWRP
jgi:hypothetical protein